MNNLNTHTPIKTPIRRLGLVRSVKKTVSSESAPVTPVTPKPSCPSVNPSTSSSTSEDVSTPVPNRLRPIKGTCSVDSSGDSSSDEAAEKVATPVTTPAASALSSGCKRLRLSLSQSWRNRIIQKKELNLKRRKLMDDVELCSESDSKDQKDPEDIASVSRLEAPSDGANSEQKPTSILQKINDLKANISIWRAGCVQALTDLQERRGTGDMESLLNMLQIPHQLVNYDPESQDFLDPD